MGERLIERILRIRLPSNRSAFLWGPRKTGKTTYLRQNFKDALWVDLHTLGRGDNMSTDTGIGRENSHHLISNFAC
jgi:predicted kinase